MQNAALYGLVAGAECEKFTEDGHGSARPAIAPDVRISRSRHVMETRSYFYGV